MSKIIIEIKSHDSVITKFDEENKSMGVVLGEGKCTPYFQYQGHNINLYIKPQGN